MKFINYSIGTPYQIRTERDIIFTPIFQVAADAHGNTSIRIFFLSGMSKKIVCVSLRVSVAKNKRVAQVRVCLPALLNSSQKKNAANLPGAANQKKSTNLIHNSSFDPSDPHNSSSDPKIDTMIKKIQECFRDDRIYYSRHARDEMEGEESGEIKDEEIFETVLTGKIIDDYPDDEPYPSCLIYGRTTQNRPLHVVCAYSEDEKLSIVITAYQPHPERWIDFSRRQK